MRILGIETSCDETAAAIIQTYSRDSRIQVIASAISTSLGFHAKTGGIIPEVAARQQTQYIIPVIQKVFDDTNLSEKDIDAIAVTAGPGLIGSLLVGTETAKTLSYIWNKPIIPVNHLLGHIYANWIGSVKIKFPAIALIVSGGHTDLLYFKGHNDYQWLGGTRDDAAGEALDKIGRLLDMPYPAGPAIEVAATKGDPKAFIFPRPLMHSTDFDFSFSGLKTAALRLTQKLGNINETTKNDIAYGVQQAIIDILVKKTMRAVKEYNAKSILLCGGVAANQSLRDRFSLEIKNLKLESELFAPAAHLCTDNAAMIATAAFFNQKTMDAMEITANPELYFE